MEDTTSTPQQNSAELREWVTPELIVEDVLGVTRGGGAAAPLFDPETGSGLDPEFYAS